MKTINVTFTDAEHARLMKAKKDFNKECNTKSSWHKFILIKCCKGVSVKRNGNKL